MTDRICPRCTCVIVIPVVDIDQKQIGWPYDDCGLQWMEKESTPFPTTARMSLRQRLVALRKGAQR
jgi:hypothetical protein